MHRKLLGPILPTPNILSCCIQRSTSVQWIPVKPVSAGTEIFDRINWSAFVKDRKSIWRDQAS